MDDFPLIIEITIILIKAVVALSIAVPLVALVAYSVILLWRKVNPG